MNLSSTECFQLLKQAGFTGKSTHDTAHRWNVKVGTELILQWVLGEGDDQKLVDWKCKVITENLTEPQTFYSENSKQSCTVMTYNLEYVPLPPLYPSGYVGTYAFLNRECIYDLKEKTGVTWRICPRRFRMLSFENSPSYENDSEEESEDDEEDDEEEVNENEEYDPDLEDSEEEALDWSSKPLSPSKKRRLVRGEEDDDEEESKVDEEEDEDEEEPMNHIST